MTARGSPKFSMIRRDSAKLSMSMATILASRKKNSRKGGGAKEIDGKSRATWNPALEKSLVLLLHEHNNTCFRNDNKWSTEAWNEIVKEFYDRNRHVSFTKIQIQEKEGQLKRDYKMLKEERRQGGCTWNEDRCTIEGGTAFWDNLIITFPKAKKFRNNKASFPLFDELRELYDGHTPEEIYNFTTNESQEDPPVRQVDNTYEIQDFEEVMAYDVEDEDTQVQRIEDEDASSERGEQMPRRRDSLSRDEEDEDTSVERNGQQRRAAMESRNTEEKEAKRPKTSGNIEGLLERYLKMRTKQVEDEDAQVAKIKEAAQGTDFSIKRCVCVLNSMEVTKVEKAKAYAVFKNQDNREIFLSACSEDPESAIIWLRNEMA